MKRHLLAVLAAVGIAVTAATAVGTPAHAAWTPQCGYDIPIGDIRFYEHADFTGRWWTTAGDEFDLSNDRYTNGDPVNDQFSSARNCGEVWPGSEVVAMFQHAGYKGYMRCLDRDQYARNLTNWQTNGGTNMNDQISSFKWVGWTWCHERDGRYFS